MSSLVRRIQKNIAKAQGFYRSRVSGDIINTDGDSVGKRWPQVAAPTSPKELERRINKTVRALDKLELQAEEV